MKLAILGGTGKEGQGLALRWARAGRQICLGSREREKGERVAAELNEMLGDAAAVTGMTNDDAAREGDVIVSTLPDKGQIEILQGIRRQLDGKLLITASIAWPPGSTERLSAAEEIQEALEGVHVVAAFQTVSAGTLRQLDSTQPEDVLLFSDDDDARGRAKELVDETGLRGVHAGALRQTRVAEAITGLLLKVNRIYGVKSTGIRITGLPEEG